MFRGYGTAVDAGYQIAFSITALKRSLAASEPQSSVLQSTPLYISQLISPTPNHLLQFVARHERGEAWPRVVGEVGQAVVVVQVKLLADGSPVDT